MDPVSTISQILKTLRQGASQTGSLARSKAKSGPSGDKLAPAEGAESRMSLEQLEQRILERLRGLDPAGSSSQRAAEIFVETVLIWEFGEEVLQDPKFLQLATDVREALETDPKISSQLQAFLKSS